MTLIMYDYKRWSVTRWSMGLLPVIILPQGFYLFPGVPHWRELVIIQAFFLEPTIALTQRDSVNPAGFKSFIQLLQRTSIFYAVWRSYRAISSDLGKKWGTLNLESSMNLIRNGYSGKTDFLLKLIVTLAKGTSFNRAWNIWVADPISGDILICFANNGKISFENPVHHFNMFELFET